MGLLFGFAFGCLRDFEELLFCEKRRSLLLTLLLLLILRSKRTVCVGVKGEHVGCSEILCVIIFGVFLAKVTFLKEAVWQSGTLLAVRAALR